MENSREINCKKRKRIRLAIVLLILLFILFILVENAGIYIYVEKLVPEESAENYTTEVNIEQSQEKEFCENKSFRFSVEGGTVQTYGNTVRPDITITNLEDRWGYFRINFSFIDNEKFPFEKFGGNNLEESLAAGKISYKDAEFYSENYEFYLGPGETRRINNRTRKESESVLWAIANVMEPSYQVCTIKTMRVNITENRSFTKQKSGAILIKEREFRRLSDILFNNFIPLLLILITLAAIIIMLYRITEKLK